MRFALTTLLGAALVVAACSTSSHSGADDGGAGTEAWRTATLRDVVSGEDFRIADLQGKVVAIEAMAIWCSTCRIQQLEAQAALAEVDSPDVVYPESRHRPERKGGGPIGVRAARGVRLALRGRTAGSDPIAGRDVRRPGPVAAVNAAHRAGA